jgi:hypothetical protein
MIPCPVQIAKQFVLGSISPRVQIDKVFCKVFITYFGLIKKKRAHHVVAMRSPRYSLAVARYYQLTL